MIPLLSLLSLRSPNLFERAAVSLSFSPPAIFLAVSTFASRRNSSDYSGYAAGSAQVEELTSQNAELRQQVDDLKRQASSSGSSSALQSQVNDLQSQVNSLTQKNSSLQKENSSLRKQVNDYKPDAERWRRQMDLNK